MRKRTAARRIALQALYQWDVRGDAFADEVKGFLLDWGRTAEEESFARELVLGTREHLADIDVRLQALAQHWALDRMAALDRNILRLAAYEMVYRDDIPPRVSIDEAVDLAKRFSTEESGSFVNGVLDPLMNSLAPPAGDGSSPPL